MLDAVGAGELPDAGQYGDEGSDTLGNVARAVGGLDLPSLEALGLGNVEPLEGCPPQPGAPAVAGRLIERSKGKDTTTGHWELMGVVTAQAFPTYPHGFPHDVIDPFMHRTGRGVLGNKAASGTEIIQELGEEHQRDGQVDRLHVGRLRLPDRRPRGHGPARGALRRLPRRARDPHRQARRRPRHRAAVHGRAGQLRPDAEPPRLLARAAPAELPHAHPRGRPEGLRRRQDRRHLRRLRHRRVASRRSRTSRGSSRPSGSCVSSTTGSSSSTSSRRTCSGATATTRSTSTAACRTSTAACPICSTRSVPATSSSSRRTTAAIPTTPSTDHSREHALLLAYVEGRNAAGRIHEGEFADVGATVNAWLGGKAPSRGIPGQPIVTP